MIVPYFKTLGNMGSDWFALGRPAHETGIGHAQSDGLYIVAVTGCLDPGASVFADTLHPFHNEGLRPDPYFQGREFPLRDKFRQDG